MLLIDDTYFKNDISIPTNQIESLNDYISYYETEFLRKVLGVEMFNEFKTAIESGTPDQKWLDLTNGADYIGYNNKIYHWEGFVNETLKRSIIADYVYCKFVFNNIITYETNLIESLSENAKEVQAFSLYDKYNNVVKKIGLIPFKNFEYDIDEDVYFSDNKYVRKLIQQKDLQGTLFDFLYWSNKQSDAYNNLLFTELNYLVKL